MSRPGEVVFKCWLHGYEVRGWRLTVGASRGRIAGCSTCAAVFNQALDAIGFAHD